MDYHDLFTYNPVSGCLTWKERPLRHFHTQRGCRVFNSKHAHTIAGSSVFKRNGTKDAVRVKVGGNKQAHRVIWEMVNGPIPDGMVIDHVNGDPFDNRLHNLRLTTHSQNLRNQKLRKDSRSRIKGVMRRSGGWVARIVVDGRRVQLGTFYTKGLAAVAYAKAAIRYHGEYARVS